MTQWAAAQMETFFLKNFNHLNFGPFYTTNFIAFKIAKAD
jgi:hypothetical protein